MVWNARCGRAAHRIVPGHRCHRCGRRGRRGRGRGSGSRRCGLLLRAADDDAAKGENAGDAKRPVYGVALHCVLPSQMPKPANGGPENARLSGGPALQFGHTRG